MYYASVGLEDHSLPRTERTGGSSIRATVFFVSDASEVGCCGHHVAELEPLIRTLEGHPARLSTVRVPLDPSAPSSALDALQDAFKRESHADGMNFVVSLGLGGVLALRLARIFTKHDLAGIVLVAPRASSSSSTTTLSLFSSFSFSSSWLLEVCARRLPSWALRVAWPLLKGRVVASRYGGDPSGDPTLEQVAARRRADCVSPAAYLQAVHWFARSVCSPSSSSSSSSSTFWSSHPLSSYDLAKYRGTSLTPVVAVHGESQTGEAAAVAAKLGLKPDRCRIVRRKPGQQRPHQQAVGGFGVAEERPAEVAAEVMRLVQEVHDRRVELGLLGAAGDRNKATTAGGGGGAFEGDRSVADRLIDDPDDFATF